VTAQKRTASRARGASATATKTAKAKRARAAARRERELRDTRQARTLLAQGRFLADFARCGVVLRAAQAAAVGRRTVYLWLEQKDFKRLYDEALEDALDGLEEEARRRAVDGVLEPMVSAGIRVCDKRVFSDGLLTTLLKGKKPDTYRERHEVTGKNGGPLLTREEAGELTDQQLQAAILALAAKAQDQPLR
jgi:hypothetical protein